MKIYSYAKDESIGNGKKIMDNVSFYSKNWQTTIGRGITLPKILILYSEKCGHFSS